MKYLIIDSSIYKSECYKYDKGLLNYICKLCHIGKIKLIYSDIIYREVINLMNEQISEFNKNISSALKTISFLSESDILKPISSISKEQIMDLSKDMFDHYLKSCRAMLIEQNININSILDDYFNAKPPFGSGNKKHEFPDAIILNSLNNMVFEDSDIIYFLSSDKDWEKFCINKAKYKYFDNTYDCVIELSSDGDKNMLYDEQLDNWIRKDKILNEVNNLLECELLNNFDVSKIINNDSQVVDNNSTLSINIDPNCVYFNKEDGVLDFDISFETNVDFTTEGLDYDNAYYDKEDEKYYNLNQIMLNYKGTVQGVAVISLDVTFEDKHHVKINKIKHIEIFQDEINNNKENIIANKIDFDCDDLYD